MKDWKQAARGFIDSCSFKDDIEAAFLTGSHAFGNADSFSDIDLYIILSDDVNWRERGSKEVYGFRIEYFANPLHQVMQYIDDNYLSVRLPEINMILGGIIIFDKNDMAEKTIAYCKQKLLSNFPKMNEFNIKMGLYTVWDNLDKLQRAYTNQTPDIAMQFFCFIKNTFELYSRYIGSPIPNYHKWYRWLTDEDYSSRYGLDAYKDMCFLDKIKVAFKCTDPEAMLWLSTDLYQYITSEMGGLDVDDFILRGQLLL